MLRPEGILPAMVTPLTEEGKFNHKALEKLIDYMIRGGVHGIFAMGTTAEFYGIGQDMYREILLAAKEYTGGRLPVYAGANSITTSGAMELVEIASQVGVDAISVLTPMFISPSDEELFEHYRMIAESTDKPVLLYNNTPKTGVNLTPELVERLADIPNIVGIKDSKGDFTQISSYIQKTADKEFRVLVGRDTLIYANLCQGGAGAVAACANVAPRLCADIYDYYRAGNKEKALECQNRLNPLRLAFGMGTFPAVIKEALTMLGIEAGPCFSPILPLHDDQKAKLRGILETMGLLQ